MNNQRSAESRLSVAFTLCVAFGATASITSGIAWGQWKDTLDQCVNKNCSCILYGKNTPNHFLGGDAAPCIWVTFGPLIYVLFCVGLACFHGFRILFGSKSTTRSIPRKNEAGETVVMQIQTENISYLPRSYWITASVFTCFFSLYALIHFSIYLDGYLHTCKEYRDALIKQLDVHGTITPVLHSRLACNAIFDFMDYIQPDSGNAYRNGFINTAADLIIGIMASFGALASFVFSAIVTIRFARIKHQR